jgi:two-component system CheB/CheR fusion protein
VLEERIFDQFYQTDRQHDRPNGSGLGIGGIGLANVRQMAALLAHRIDLRSRLGRGSVFTVVVADVPNTIARAVA